MTDIITRVPQDRETAPQTQTSIHGSYRYTYSRSQDSQQSGEAGQDYLVIRENESRLSFALCDGVGQSFFGGLAAAWVGDRLVEWFSENADSRAGVDKLRTGLAAQLTQLAVDSGEKVRFYPLPAGLSPMVRQVLEQKRNAGSQTTFAAGLVDWAGQRLVLAWMGDSRIRLWDRSGVEITHYLGDTFDTRERWVSGRGLEGSLHLFSCSLARVGRVMVYSDGLLERGEVRIATADPDILNGLFADVTQSPAGDDTSLLEIRPAVTAAVTGGAGQAGTDAAARFNPMWLLVLAGLGLVGGLVCVLVVVGGMRFSAMGDILGPDSSDPTATLTPADPTQVPVAASATPSLTPTFSPSPSSTTLPSSTPSPTSTWTPSPSPAPTTTPMLTWTPSPSPIPTSTMTPTPTPNPTWTSTPVPSPEPSWTAHPGGQVPPSPVLTTEPGAAETPGAGDGGLSTPEPSQTPELS